MIPNEENIRTACTELTRLAFANLEFFPKQTDALNAMAKCLCNASADLEHMRKVVDELSRSCKKAPSFAVIIEVANACRPPERRRERCGLCIDGYRTFYFLHTKEGVGAARFTRKEPITEAEYQALQGLAKDDDGNILHPVRPRLDPQLQQVYSGAGRCPCAGGA